MKERELRQHATCSLCKEKIGHTGLPLFWRVKIERFGIDMHAVQRQTGLAMMLGGNAAIAAAMGPDEDLAKVIYEVTLTVCEDCAVNTMVPISSLTELAEQEEPAEKEE